MIFDQLLTPAQLQALPTGTSVMVHFRHRPGQTNKPRILHTLNNDAYHVYQPGTGAQIAVEPGTTRRHDKIYVIATKEPQ